MNATTTQTGRIMRLQINVPETIAYTEMRSVQSKFGQDEVLLSLTDGHLLYLPLYVGGKIKSAGIVENQMFTICKRETVSGNRRSADYELGAAATAPTSTAFGDQSNARTQSTPLEIAAQLAKFPGWSQQPQRAPEPVRSIGRVFLPEFAEQPPREDKREESLAIRTGREAIDAVLAVEGYAQQKGLTDFEFGPEGIKSLWITLLIQRMKGGQ